MYSLDKPWSQICWSLGAGFGLGLGIGFRLGLGFCRCLGFRLGLDISFPNLPLRFVPILT
jgi:hypothetical protein